MDASQVSEASMASMFRRAADAIVNESSLKMEVMDLSTQAQISAGRIESLSSERSKLNDYVEVLQQQLAAARDEIVGHRRDKADQAAIISKHEDDKASLQDLLYETEQARDAAKLDAEAYFSNWNAAEEKLTAAEAKLKTIQSALGMGQSEPRPTILPLTESGGTPPETSDTIQSSDPAPEVAAPSTFPQVAQQPSHTPESSDPVEHTTSGLSTPRPNGSEPWRSGDSATPSDSDTTWKEATQEPQQQSDPVPADAVQPRDPWYNV